MVERMPVPSIWTGRSLIDGFWQVAITSTANWARACAKAAPANHESHSRERANPRQAREIEFIPPPESLIRRHDIRHRALQLLCGGALAHHAAEGRIAQHFRVAKAPSHAAFGVEPHQPFGPLADATQNVGARVEVVAAGIAQ